MGDKSGKKKPVISIIIPVLNEGDRIASLLDHIRTIQGDIRPENIVVDGDAGGRYYRCSSCLECWQSSLLS
jgi:hypothetical protein